MDLKEAIQDIIRDNGTVILNNNDTVIGMLSDKMPKSSRKIIDVKMLMTCGAWKALVNAIGKDEDIQRAANDRSLNLAMQHHLNEDDAVHLINQITEGFGYSVMFGEQDAGMGQNNGNENRNWENEKAAPKKKKNKIGIILLAVFGVAILIVAAYKFLGGSNKTEPDFTWNGHGYCFRIEDCTWEEAQQRCVELGGHLVTFDKSGEYEAILEEINRLRGYNYNSIKNFIGGCRTENGLGNDYDWIDAKGKYYGMSLQGSPYWGKPAHGEREPNFMDGETKMMLFEYTVGEDGTLTWGWFDVPNDAIAAANNYAGRTGYICELD